VRRREFIAVVGGAAAAWPLAARAQQPERVRRIGVLMAHPEADVEFESYVAAFRDELQKLGWAEGRNIRVDTRWGALDDDIYLNPFKSAAASLGLEAIAAPVNDRSEFESVVAAQARGPNSGLMIMPNGFLNVHRAEIILLAARYHLPAVYPWRFFAEVGGLLSYGSEQQDHFRLGATYVDRILKGEKPADLPVQAPIKYDLVINLKTAKTLGLTVPSTLLARADEVIE
jgi:ABC transporter substrate binding protein